MTDIEKELERFISSGKATTNVNSGRFQTTYIDPLKIAKHFAQWQREQMMKDAIDSQVKWCNHGYPDIHMEDLAVLDEVQLPKDKFAIGGKVKVIIVKE